MNVLDIIKNQRGEQQASLLQEHGKEVAMLESNNNPQRIQTQRSDNKETGPGRGLYQYEVSDNTLGGVSGSGASKTALQRYYNFYEKYGEQIPKQYQDQLSELNKDNPDFSQLSEDLQTEIFYADKERGSLPLDKLASGELSLEDAYVDYHWVGNDKSDSYTAERDRVSKHYRNNIKPQEKLEETSMMAPEQKEQMEMAKAYDLAYKSASLQKGYDFDMLDIMEDLGQVFIEHDKEKA